MNSKCECVDAKNKKLIEKISNSKSNVKNVTRAICPECGGNLVFEGGCNTCKDCGWSKCD